MSQATPSDPTRPEHVAPRLTALRAALGLSKTDFAAAIGLDKSSYSKVEKGTKPLPVSQAGRIWALWGVDFNFLYMGRIDGLPVGLAARIGTRLSAGTAAEA